MVTFKPFASSGRSEKMKISDHRCGWSEETNLLSISINLISIRKQLLIELVLLNRKIQLVSQVKGNKWHTFVLISSCFLSSTFVASTTCVMRASDRVEWSWAVLSMELTSWLYALSRVLEIGQITEVATCIKLPHTSAESYPRPMQPRVHPR